MVRILILVHADVAETLLVLLEHLGTCTQQLERPHQKIVEVHGVRCTQAPLELTINLRRLLLRRGRGTTAEFLRIDHGVLRRADLRANHVEWELLLLDTQTLHDVAHQAARIVIVVDGELTGIP